MLNSKTNRKPADRLADVRDLIKSLQQEEADLREEFIAGKHDLVGDQYQVSITQKDFDRVDVKALRKDFKPAALKPYLKTTPMTFVRTEKRHG